MPEADRTELSAAQTPELVKAAARAMLNDPDSISGELVRAWKALVAENRELRREIDALLPHVGGDGYAANAHPVEQRRNTSG